MPHESPRVCLVAWTQFEPPDDPAFTTDADGGQALVEFAGRACYETWDKPYPATATNAGFLRHLLDVGHLSALEHSSVTFYVTRLSRAVAQELLRHRHLSVSQLSPGYDHGPQAPVVEPAAIAAHPELHKRFQAAVEASRHAYEELRAGLEHEVADAPGATLRRKQARQAARAVLPEATETRLVVTGNYRAWRHFVAVRATEHADVGLRTVAVACLRELQRVAPHVFDDFAIAALPDGSEIAASPLTWES